LLTICRFQNNNKNEFKEFIYDIFKRITQQNVDSNKEPLSNLQLKLINLLFELKVRSDLQSDCETSFNIEIPIQTFIELNSQNYWQIFKLARMCVRYGSFNLGHLLYQKLSHQILDGFRPNMATADLSYKSWLDFMALLCQGESLISETTASNINEFIKHLNEAMDCYLRAQYLFKSSCTRCLNTTTGNANGVSIQETSTNCFQLRYCELRTEQIKLYIQLILSTMTYKTVPPPVFQFNSAESFGKFGRIAQQMKYSIVEIQKLIQKYKELLFESFDADSHTINMISICRKQNECLVYFIGLLSSSASGNSNSTSHSTSMSSGNKNSEAALKDEFTLMFLTEKSKKQSDSCDEFAESSAEIKMNENFCLKLFNKLKYFNKQDKRENEIKHFQEILIDFIRLTMPLPRAFFNTLQKTQIKLIINPNHKKLPAQQMVIVKSDQSLVVKIDGIVSQQCKTRLPIRTIEKVQISLITELDVKSMPDNKVALQSFSNSLFNN
jgi:hypothetical protein